MEWKSEELTQQFLVDLQQYGLLVSFNPRHDWSHFMNLFRYVSYLLPQN